ncbi:pyrimidine dimer DNA glycosylase/endonuclease V [Flavobacteriaceae bacterium]|nr:pyrimidine dimer DNA glycosylase/endonuclease V [Flavobacteriaceae bacterium]
MNLFILDLDPVVAASYHNDTHVTKMLLEACQILCTAHHVHNPNQYEIPYKIAHLNHPCTKWVRETKANHEWALKLARALCIQYTYRTGKLHKCTAVVDWLEQKLDQIAWSNVNLTPFVLAMPDRYQCSDPVLSYRLYHQSEKRGYWRKIRNSKLSTWYPYKFSKVIKPTWIDVSFDIGPHSIKIAS